MTDILRYFGTFDGYFRQGGAPQTVTQVLFDPLFAAVYARWLDCMAESDRELLAVFEKFDADHDGSLSLTEFSTLVTAVDLGVDSAGKRSSIYSFFSFFFCTC